MESPEIDLPSAIARIEMDGFTDPETDGKVVLKFLKILNDERARAVHRIDTLEANQFTAAHAATVLGLIEKLAERFGRVEAQLAILQRQINSATN